MESISLILLFYLKKILNGKFKPITTITNLWRQSKSVSCLPETSKQINTRGNPKTFVRTVNFKWKQRCRTGILSNLFLCHLPRDIQTIHFMWKNLAKKIIQETTITLSLLEHCLIEKRELQYVIFQHGFYLRKCIFKLITLFAQTNPITSQKCNGVQLMMYFERGCCKLRSLKICWL